ncbi:uncharacterized protein LOC133508713 isoform X3 [Syngnathoides biaculeatus]|uniref:uncharacterized protein LOC133508713 isoform X3 n=1 Tax=Syngnathoides biaculeatus TaxID=300417 RepID=UPI002ADDDD76|nr:uncharacterized protein LOC133508713 isoform X3 [Syngnathoides biaculeatus]
MHDVSNKLTPAREACVGPRGRRRGRLRRANASEATIGWRGRLWGTRTKLFATDRTVRTWVRLDHWTRPWTFDTRHWDSPEAEPSVFPDLRSDTGPAGSPVTFRCSVFSRPHNKTCTDGHDVFWFRAATDVAHPSFVYAREDCGEVESGSVQKCVHGFSKDVGSSEAGTYSCAVAACGQIFVTTAKTIIKEDSSKCSLHGFVIIIMSVALVISFIVSGFLIFKIKTKICFCFQARPQTSDETVSGVQQRRDEDALVYSVPTVVRKSGKVRQTNEEFSTYTDVRLHES